MSFASKRSVSVTSTGLSLTAVTSGVVTTVNVTFAANVTVLALENAINALGNGWLAQAKNNSGAASSLTAFAYCLAG